MRIFRTFERPALFSVTDDGDLASIAEGLSLRQRALLVGALNYHALDVPGGALKVQVYLGRRGGSSSLTDVRTRRKPTHHVSWIGEFAVASKVQGEPHDLFTPTAKKLRRRHDFAPDHETGERHIVLDLDPSADQGDLFRNHGLYWGLRMAVERRFPFAYDRVRQFLIRGREAELLTRRLSRTQRDPDILPEGRGLEEEPAVLFGLHWLDLGGAERWAVKTIEAAWSHGLRPIVITDVDSAHPWITRPELSEAVVVPLTHPIGQPENQEPVLDAIARNWDVRGVFVHHCRWLYDRLPWLKRRLPSVPIVDSQHILEYNGGGYPSFGVILDDSIDIHHVISPQLRDWLRDVQGVADHKIELAPLMGLTTSTTETVKVRPRVEGAPFRVGFIGRFAHQKRPYLFLKLIESLRQALPSPIHAVIQGSGALESFVQREIDRHDLRDIVTLRGESAPVSETLAMIDVLVISSQNEGIALTALEAIAAGVPVVSADVGSQRTVVAEIALVSREPHEFIPQASAILAQAARSEDFRRQIWVEEARLADEFSRLEPSDRWLERKMIEWSK
ncbi:glycosyltransferase family protein [Humibacter ginsengisoli]